MKIAITGAKGFVGSNLVKQFSAAGHELSALVRANSSVSLLPADTRIIRIDYRNVEALQQFLATQQVLIHNAGKTKALNHQEMLSANLGITNQILKAINPLDNPLHFIYISSQAASRPCSNHHPVNEEDTPAPPTTYGKSKLAAEKAIRNTCRQPWTIVRPCSIYGCGDRDFLTLFKMAKKGLSFQIGHQDRQVNMIHVEELAAFLLLVANNKNADHQVFFATDGCVYYQSELMSAIAAALDKHLKQLTIPESIARMAFYAGDFWGRIRKRETVVNKEKMKEIMGGNWLADISKAKRLLGWEPNPDLQKRMKETARCYAELGWL